MGLQKITAIIHTRLDITNKYILSSAHLGGLLYFLNEILKRRNFLLFFRFFNNDHFANSAVTLVAAYNWHHWLEHF